MRAAMAAAEVGDDERDGDPTTRRLEERVAALLGKDAALFFPSGVMANQAGIWVHAGRGTEVLLDANRTPSFPTEQSPNAVAAAADLAAGIDGFLV